MFCSHNKKNICCRKALGNPVYFNWAGRKNNPLSQLDNEKIMMFDVIEGKFYFPELP